MGLRDLEFTKSSWRSSWTSHKVAPDTNDNREISSLISVLYANSRDLIARVLFFWQKARCRIAKRDQEHCWGKICYDPWCSSGQFVIYCSRYQLPQDFHDLDIRIQMSEAGSHWLLSLQPDRAVLQDRSVSHMTAPKAACSPHRDDLLFYCCWHTVATHLAQHGKWSSVVVLFFCYAGAGQLQRMRTEREQTSMLSPSLSQKRRNIVQLMFNVLRTFQQWSFYAMANGSMPRDIVFKRSEAHPLYIPNCCDHVKFSCG